MNDGRGQLPRAVVGLARAVSYDAIEELMAAMRQALAPCGGMGAFVHPGQRVLLKANLLGPARPDEAVTTHPEFVRAAIRLVKEAGGRPFVGDGPGVGDTMLVLKATGMLQVLEEEGAEPAVFAETSVYENESNILLKRLPLTDWLSRCDVLITLPKLKTHVQMGYTGAVKNQFGLVPGAAKSQYHFRFQDRNRLADLIIDINRTGRPALALMDAVVAMEGKGPSGGNPRPLGLVLASADLPALDVVGCTLIGFPPDDNPLNMAARRAGWGTTRLEDIDVCGISLSEARCADFALVRKPVSILRLLPLPPFALRFIRRQFAPRPVINPALCRKCGRCARGCPVTPAAINPWADTAADRLNDRTCIRCYCCHEFCPVKAIDLKKSLLARCLPLPAIADCLARGLGHCRTLFRFGSRC